MHKSSSMTCPAVAIRTPPVRHPPASMAAGSAETTLRRAGDQDRIAGGLNGIVTLLAAGMVLAAVPWMTGDHRAAGTIQHLFAVRDPAIGTHPVHGGRALAGGGTADSAEMARRRIDDHDRIAQGLNDVVVRRLFAAGLDLEIVLGLIGDYRASSEVCRAIDELDEAIRDIRDAVFGSRPS